VDAERAIGLLLAMRKQRGTDRYVNLYLGRLYKALERYRNASEAMTSFIQRKQQAGEGDDQDITDAYYNRACYQNLLRQKVAADEAKELRPSIEADLKRSISLDEQIKKFAFDDEDFESVKGEVWFKQLTES